MGILMRLSDQQEALKARVMEIRETEDPSFDEALLNLFMDQPIEELVNVAIIHAEMEGKENGTEDSDLEWASEFLDHLDTIGWKITPKNRRQRRQIPAMREMPGG